MSYVTVAELEQYLIQNNFVKTDDVRTTIQELIREQHATFEAVRHEIVTTAEQARGHATTFDTKYAESVAKIQEIEANVIASQNALLDHMKTNSEGIQAELVKMSTFSAAQLTATTASFTDLENRTAKFVAEREANINATMEDKLNGADQRLRVNMVSLMATARAELGTSTGGGPSGSYGGGPRDRSAFDARDYKIHDLEASPSLAAVRKWRHDVELFVDTLGSSWLGVSSMLRNCRLVDQEFNQTGLLEVIEVCEKVDNRTPVDADMFEFATKSDTLYKLLMPRLNLSLSTEFRQIGTSNGFELFRKVIRKLDPPKSDNTFHLANEIRGLGGTSPCKDFAQTCRFLLFLENRLKEFLIETGTSFLPADAARVLSQAVDEDTLGRLEDASLPPEDNYERVKNWIREREN